MSHPGFGLGLLQAVYVRFAGVVPPVHGEVAGIAATAAGAALLGALCTLPFPSARLCRAIAVLETAC